MTINTFAKQRIKAPHTLLCLNMPESIGKEWSKLPEGIALVTHSGYKFNSVHWFVMNKKEVDSQFASVLKLVEGTAKIIWCYYPKRSGKLQTDLTRDQGWENLMREDIKWLSLISVNETFSAFAFRFKSEKELSIPVRQVPREIEAFADPKTRTVRLPDDLNNAFLKNKAAAAKFNALAYSNRREYVDWVITAKREETRQKRVSDTITKLLEGKKNPSEK